MQYLGGKTRIAARIGKHLDALATQSGGHVEDRFCGALSVAAEIRTRPLVCSDANAALVCTLRAAMSGWTPPETLTETEYAELRARADPTDPRTAFAAAGCSFGAKWWGGYARNAKGDNYAGRARRSLMRRVARLQGVEVRCADWRENPPTSGTVVYLDPPYADAVGYPGCGEFDSAEFWRIAAEWAARGVVVRVSEYTAPDGWAAVEEFGDVQVLGRSRGAAKVRRDALWKHVGGL